MKIVVILCLFMGIYSLNRNDFNIVNWKNFIEMHDNPLLKQKSSFLEVRSNNKLLPKSLETHLPGDAMKDAFADLKPTINSYSVTNNMNYLTTLPENYISPSPGTLKRCFKIEQSWLDNCQVKWDMYKYARGNSQGYGMYTPFCWWILNTSGDDGKFCKDEVLWKDLIDTGENTKYKNLKDCQNLCEMVYHNLDCNTEISNQNLNPTKVPLVEVEKDTNLEENLKNPTMKENNFANFKAHRSIRRMASEPCYCTYGKISIDGKEKWVYHNKAGKECKKMEIFFSMQECCVDRRHNCCWSV